MKIFGRAPSGRAIRDSAFASVLRTPPVGRVTTIPHAGGGLFAETRKGIFKIHKYIFSLWECSVYKRTKSEQKL